MTRVYTALSKPNKEETSVVRMALRPITSVPTPPDDQVRPPRVRYSFRVVYCHEGSNTWYKSCFGTSLRDRETYSDAHLGSVESALHWLQTGRTFAESTDAEDE